MSTLRNMIICDSADLTRRCHLDLKTNVFPVIDFSHHKVHAASTFDLNCSAVSAGTDQYIEILITPPPVPEVGGKTEFHTVWTYSTSGAGEFLFLKDVTYTSGGTPVVAQNKNMNSLRLSSCTGCYIGTTAVPITRTTGTAVRTEVFGSGKAAGQQSINDQEWILKNGISTVFRLTSKAANSTLWLAISWYEQEDLYT